MAEMTVNPNVASDLAFDLAAKERAQRKTLITVAEWTPAGETKATRELLGVRTENFRH